MSCFNEFFFSDPLSCMISVFGIKNWLFIAVRTKHGVGAWESAVNV